MEMRIRNDLTGEWDVEPLADPIEYPPPSPRVVSFMEITGINPDFARVPKSFVRVECATAPAPVLDHAEVDDFWGMGLVIDANLGLVVVSRAVVPHAACDTSIVVAESVTVKSEVVFLHPSQNFTILKYDPKLILGSIETAVLSSDRPLQGDTVYFLGYTRQKKVVHASTNITSVHAATLRSTSQTPTYCATNTDVIDIDTSLGQACGSGVLVSDNGVVQALWLTYLGKDSSDIAKSTRRHFGLSVAAVQQALAHIRAEGSTKLRILPAEFGQIQLAEARDRGLAEELFQAGVEGNLADWHHFLVCKQLLENQTETEGLKEGDILLKLGDRPIKSMSDLTISLEDENVGAVVFRDRKVTKVDIATLAAKDIETNRVIRFCGAYLHAPHLAVRQQRGKLHSEVYVSSFCPGSPAHQYGLYAAMFITNVDGAATPTLDQFLDAVQRIADKKRFLLKVVDSNDIISVITIKKDEHYFPMIDWNMDVSAICGWSRRVCGPPGADGN
ncbi:Pro-apoptotic serine protease [Colletotrichum fructicola]|nr:Pro-apoptotic serine protease [Colletotrichum fructicola]KAE9566758.1 Pro-apoptotic serine protease [Colletotrichum fructicola]